MATKLEANIRSLVAHCEELVQEDASNWLLKTYIKSLDTLIKDLSECNDGVGATAIDEYRTRCQTIKEAANYTDTSAATSANGVKHMESGEHILKEIGQLHDARYSNSMRRDLLGSNDDSTGLRRRVNAGEDMNKAVKHYADLQEKLAEDMLMLTRNLKEQTETASKIIKKDTEVVSKSAQLSEVNYTKLSNEAATLRDHSNRACKCWMWIMIGTVMVVFIFMVLFMKVMKKRVE